METAYEEKEITVSELIDILQKMPPSALVALEGCDCYGKAIGVEYRSDQGGGYAFIYREDGVDSDERQKNGRHVFKGRHDRWCEICNQPDRAPIHIHKLEECPRPSSLQN